ncbi:MAG: metallophosphoesterase [Actinomycetota bacterium]
MIRIAAVGDLHLGVESRSRFRARVEGLPSHADVLLVAGDLTKCGGSDEAEVVAAELRDLGVPVVVVLGNHDYHADKPEEMTKILTENGVYVLDGSSVILDVNGERLGIAGSKGFGGGFAGACGTDFGEPEMKSFVWHTKRLSADLEEALGELDTEHKVVLLHYAPVRDTLQGEPLEIYPFLGSYLLAEAIDCAGADLVIHGHAHHGSEKGITPGGINVRNVAQPVIQHAYNLYELGA